MSPAPPEFDHHIRREVLRHFAGPNVLYHYAIPTAVLTAALAQLLAHWRDRGGWAASFFSLEFALRLGISIAVMVPLLTWTLRRFARRALESEERREGDSS